MESTNCQTCKKPKATLECGLCHCPQCKKCAQMMDSDAFSFLEKIPDPLSHHAYCGQCFDNHVAQELQNYQDILEKSRDVTIYSKEQSKETRLIKRTDRLLKVTDCLDRDETIARLAFLAVKENFNTIIDVTVKNEKVIVGGYQSLKFHGTAIPIQLDRVRYKHRS